MPTLKLKRSAPNPVSSVPPSPVTQPIALPAPPKKPHRPLWFPELAEVDAGRFWFVWNVGRRRPSRRHASLEAAQLEAARLKSLHPDKDFAVFEATCCEVNANG